MEADSQQSWVFRIELRPDKLCGVSLWPQRRRECTFVDQHNNAVKGKLLSALHRWAKGWSIKWQCIIHPLPRSHGWPRSVKLRFKPPAYPCPSLTAYVMLDIVSFLEIPPRAKFFVDFLWAITGSSRVLKCQRVSISKTCHFPVTSTPRAKMEQGLRAQAFLSFSDDLMGRRGEAGSPEWGRFQIRKYILNWHVGLLSYVLASYWEPCLRNIVPRRGNTARRFSFCYLEGWCDRITLCLC